AWRSATTSNGSVASANRSVASAVRRKIRHGHFVRHRMRELHTERTSMDRRIPNWRPTRGNWIRRVGVGAGCVMFVAGLSAQAPPFKAPAPHFADPDRPAKLAGAFPEIDRIFQDFATAAHVPGAAWGVVVDGRLAHTGAT